MGGVYCKTTNYINGLKHLFSAIEMREYVGRLIENAGSALVTPILGFGTYTMACGDDRLATILMGGMTLAASYPVIKTATHAAGRASQWAYEKFSESREHHLTPKHSPSHRYGKHPNVCRRDNYGSSEWIIPLEEKKVIPEPVKVYKKEAILVG